MSDPYQPAPQTPPAANSYAQPTPYTQGAAPANDRYNVLAIVSLVLAFFVSIAAIITGHIALAQIKRTGEKGHGLALAGTILGYVFTLLGLILIIFYFVIFGALIANSGSYTTSP